MEVSPPSTMWGPQVEDNQGGLHGAHQPPELWQMSGEASKMETSCSESHSGL